MNNLPRYLLTGICPDRVGLVAAVTSYLAAQDANLLEMHHFRDPACNRSVVRISFEPAQGAALDLEDISSGFRAIARRLDMTWKIRDEADRIRALIAVSKQGHCLKSLLHRWSVGTLPVDIVGVVSNHTDQQRVAEWHGLPFFHLAIEPGRKAEQEQRMLGILAEYRADLLILARYMQVLTGDACRQLAGRAINIHHSFLPGFKGARPYHQAYARGVKLVGATAHYINEDLDEGPIIEQAVERVDHTMSAEDLAVLGNEIESLVLNRAVQWHAESRVFEFGNRTVVLR